MKRHGRRRSRAGAGRPGAAVSRCGPRRCVGRRGDVEPPGVTGCPVGARMQRQPGFVEEPSDRGPRGLVEDPERLVVFEELLEQMASHSRDVYRDLVDRQPDFERFFEQATPDRGDRTATARLPSARRGGSQRIAELRSIPGSCLRVALRRADAAPARRVTRWNRPAWVDGDLRPGTDEHPLREASRLRAVPRRRRVTRFTMVVQFPVGKPALQLSTRVVERLVESPGSRVRDVSRDPWSRPRRWPARPEPRAGGPSGRGRSARRAGPRCRPPR